MSLVIPFLSIRSHVRSPLTVLAFTILSVAGCSRDADEVAPAAAAAATTKSDPPDGPGARPGAPGGPAAQGAEGGPGARRVSSIILAASDVKTVERGTIEAGVEISGDLKAIERHNEKRT